MNKRGIIYNFGVNMVNSIGFCSIRNNTSINKSQPAFTGLWGKAVRQVHTSGPFSWMSNHYVYKPFKNEAHEEIMEVCVKHEFTKSPLCRTLNLMPPLPFTEKEFDTFLHNPESMHTLRKQKIAKETKYLFIDEDNAFSVESRIKLIADKFNSLVENKGEYVENCNK